MKILSYIMIGLIVTQAVMYFSNKNEDIDASAMDNQGEIDEDELV